MASDIARMLYRIHRQQGPYARVPLGEDRTGILLGEPAAIQYVLEDNQANYRKAAGYRNELSAVFGRGLLTSEGDHWRRQQRIIRPLFTSANVRSYTPVITEAARELGDRWRRVADRGGTVDLLEAMERVTLTIIGRALFSADMDDHAATIRESLQVLREAFQRRTDPAAEVSSSLATDAQAARRTLDDIIYRLIEDRRGQPATHADLLSRLMRAEDTASGHRMTDEEIRDELMTFLLAGHETTAAALTWTWYLLATHPTVHEEVHSTARRGLPAADVDAGEIDVSALSYLRCCIQEAMRLYPPVPVFAREAIEADEFDGYEIPAGTQVLLSQYVIHREPAIWDEPTRYRPERFADAADDRPPYAYFPFGGGPRMCIGRQLALLEAQLILALVAREFRLELVAPSPDEDVGVSSAVTMVPDEPIRMAVTRWA